MRVRDVALAAVLSLYSVSTTAESEPAKPVIHYFFSPSKAIMELDQLSGRSRSQRLFNRRISTVNEYIKYTVDKLKNGVGDAADVNVHCADRGTRYDKWFCGYVLKKNAGTANRELMAWSGVKDPGFPAVILEKKDSMTRIRSAETLCGELNLDERCVKFLSQ